MSVFLSRTISWRKKMTMTKQESILQASKIACEQSRRRALENYYNNPKYCLNCGVIIIVGGKQKASDAKRARFCTKSCAARYNNRHRENMRTRPTGLCERCGVKIEYKYQGKGCYSPRKFCTDCFGPALSEINRNNLKKYLGIKDDCISMHDKKTKGEMKQLRPGSPRLKGFFNRHARQIYKMSGQPFICKICGYERYVDVCHIKAVSKFPDTALVSEIDSIDNLVTLCKLHHKELDDKLLDLSEESKQRAAEEMIERGLNILREYQGYNTSDILIKETLDLLKELKRDN
jgi:hypothetical protein